MQFCDSHWDRLRQAVADAGLSVLISEDREQATLKLMSELQEGTTIDNYDPLMGASLSILLNTVQLLGTAALLIPSGYPECPLCLLSRVHDEVCKGPPCTLPRNGDAYEHWIDRAVTDEIETWKSLKL